MELLRRSESGERRVRLRPADHTRPARRDERCAPERGRRRAVGKIAQRCVRATTHQSMPPSLSTSGTSSPPPSSSNRPSAATPKSGSPSSKARDWRVAARFGPPTARGSASPCPPIGLDSRGHSPRPCAERTAQTQATFPLNRDLRPFRVFAGVFRSQACMRAEGDSVAVSDGVVIQRRAPPQRRRMMRPCASAPPGRAATLPNPKMSLVSAARARGGANRSRILPKGDSLRPTARLASRGPLHPSAHALESCLISRQRVCTCRCSRTSGSPRASGRCRPRRGRSRTRSPCPARRCSE